MYVFLNSRLLPAAAAMVSVFDRGFAYGDALIETLKLQGGRPVFFQEHWQRLVKSMALAGIEADLEPEGLLHQAMALAQANDVIDGRLRIQLSRGTPATPSGPDPVVSATPTLLLSAERGGYPSDFYQSGMRCQTVPWHRGRYASLKTSSLLSSLMARREANAAGAHEALFISSHGRLLEGAFTNLFLVQAGGLVTAAEHEPILPGIIRHQVITIAAELQLPLTYAAFRLADLVPGETAALLTSSLLGICPVSQIDGLKLGRSPLLTQKLADRLTELELADISG